MLAGRCYKTRSALGSALYQCLVGIPKTDYAAAFRSWIERLQLCVRPQFFYFSFNGSADSIFSILRIKIKVYFSFCIFKFAADSKYLTIQKKKIEQSS